MSSQNFHGDRPASTEPLTPEELVRFEALLRAAARQQCLNYLYVGTAHELKSPLNSIVMNAEVLRESLEQASDIPRLDKLLRYVQVLNQEVARLDQRLHVLLAEIAPPADAIREVDLRSQLGAIAELVTPQAKQQWVEVALEVPSGEVMVAAGNGSLREALTWLSVHLLRGIPRGGVLRLALSAEADRARLTITAATTGGSDSSPGGGHATNIGAHNLNAATIIRLAETLIERVGGRIDTKLKAGHASEFRIDLPLSTVT